jgi:uroporphyrin-III C-methyltransferase / precorrin-2 dehydrogenase / sirohydrochlorin ferrochelatase
VHSLPIFVRLQGRPVILLGEGEAAEAKRRLLDRAGAVTVAEEAGAALAIVAIEDDGAALAAIDRLKARGILVNAVDRAALCDFTLPAIVDRDPVIIAIGTGGASAGLAKALRIRIEALLPARLGALAHALGGARRAMKDRWPNASDRRRALDAALQSHGLLDPLADHGDQAVDRWMTGADVARASGLHIITIASDDPDDLSLRSARLLGQADRICHHPSIAPAILARARADAVREACEKPPTGPCVGLVLYLERR